MKAIDLIVAGKLAKGPYYTLCEDYSKRIVWPLSIQEIESKYKNPIQVQADEASKILQKISPQAFVIIMDEHGKNLRSIDFANKIKNLQNTGHNHLQIIIGGADGLTDNVKKRADLTLCLGQQTWPHMLVRVMVLEQIYRAQQILSGHPYHRE